jgi:hypothetical protein
VSVEQRNPVLAGRLRRLREQAHEKRKDHLRIVACDQREHALHDCRASARAPFEARQYDH